MPSQRNHSKEDVLADLYYLRKSEGFTPGRARNAGILIDILGGPDQPYVLMRERLLAAIDTLDPDKALLLRAAFGLEPSITGRTLRERRLAYGRLVDRKVDTVMDREDQAIQELIVPLLTEQYALSPYGESATLMHTAAIQTRIHIYTTMRDGIRTGTSESYQTLCLYEGAEYLEFSTDIPGEVTSSTAHQLQLIDTGNGSRSIRCYPITPYRKGQLVNTELTFHPAHDAQSTVLREEARAFHVPTLAALFELDFIGQQPASIWHYQKKTWFQRPGTPDDQHTVHINNGHAAVRFRHLHDGLWTGIAWTWQ